MKKFYLAIAGLAVMNISNAQITLTGATSNPVLGQMNTIHTYDATTMTEGPAGANVTWDFSTIASQSSASSTVVAPNTLTYGAPFLSTSDIAWGDGNSEAYYEANANKQSIVGIVQGANDIVDNYVTNPREFLVYPLSYGTVYNETFSGTQDNNIAQIQMIRSGTITIEADAHGSLIMPYGTLNNVLRVKIHTVYSDEFMGSVIATYDDLLYLWYNLNTKHWLLSYDVFDLSGTQTIISGYYLDPLLVGVDEEANFGTSLMVYPNPASDQVNVEYQLQKGADVNIIVTDLLGKQVMQIHRENNMQGAHKEILDVSDLPTGMYIVSLASGDEVITRKISVR